MKHGLVWIRSQCFPVPCYKWYYLFHHTFPSPKQAFACSHNRSGEGAQPPLCSVYSNTPAAYHNQCPTFKARNTDYEPQFCSLMWRLRLTDHQLSWWDADHCQIPSIFQDIVQTSFPGALSEGFIRPLHDKGCYYLPSWNFCKIP